jgi:hypothetical protein
MIPAAAFRFDSLDRGDAVGGWLQSRAADRRLHRHLARPRDPAA